LDKYTSYIYSQIDGTGILFFTLYKNIISLPAFVPVGRDGYSDVTMSILVFFGAVDVFNSASKIAAEK